MKTATPEAMRLLFEGSMALSDIERAGIKVDEKRLDATIESVTKTIENVEARMKRDDVYRVWRILYKEKTNLGSREQLAKVVFSEEGLGYPPVEFTETGRPKTNKDALESVVHLPFINDFLLAEKLKKVRGTYLIGLKNELCDGYLHSVYNLHTASTYRSSNDKINFQNQPIRDQEAAALIRSNYVGKWHLVEFDISGAEVKVAYCYHKDKRMRKYLLDKSSDMHRDMAGDIFFLKPGFLLENKDWAKKTVRDTSKNMAVFPFFYGSVYFNIAVDIWKSIHRRKFALPDGTPLPVHLKRKGITERGMCAAGVDPVKGTFEYHMKQIQERFWNDRFPGYRDWKVEFFEQYLREGGFPFHTGFYVNGVYKRNDVTNYPVQGSAFHCLLWCIIQINRWLKKYKMKSRIVGQIHDSVIADVHPKELQDYMNVVHRIMTVDLPKHWPWLIIPMEVEADVCGLGESWHSKKPWICDNGLWRAA